MAAEAKLQSKILDFFREHNVFSFKVVASNKRGIPDIVVVHKGRPYFFEVKGPYGKVSPLQEYQINSIQSAGGSAIVVRSLDEVKRVLNIV